MLMMQIGTIDSEQLCITLGYIAEVLAKFHRIRPIVEGDKESTVKPNPNGLTIPLFMVCVISTPVLSKDYSPMLI